MARENRDDFSPKVILTCGQRAAYLCTNPECRQPTIGPHTDAQKSVKTGKACHIHAAAPGGPRYKPSQTPEERRSIENAIWLCSVCSDRIDKDAKRFPAELLQQWKIEHEDWWRNGGIIPKIPNLSLETLRGRTVPETLGTVVIGEEREHKLVACY